jgi:hypothetical protein
LLVLVVVLLKLFVCRFVGHQFKHRFDLLISASTLSELDQQSSVLLLSLVLGIEASHGEHLQVEVAMRWFGACPGKLDQGLVQFGGCSLGGPECEVVLEVGLGAFDCLEQLD